MRSRLLVLPTVTLLIVASALLAPGCRRQPPQAPTAEEQPEQPAQAPEQEVTQPAEVPSATESEGEPVSIQVDYDRAYTVTDMEHLGSVLAAGTASQKARVREILRDLLLNSTVSRVRAHAAAILGSVAAESEQALAKAAREDHDAQVRTAALNSLAKAPISPSLLSALAAVQQAEDATVRAAAFSAEMTARFSDPARWVTAEWLERLLAIRRDDVTAQLQIQLVNHGPVSLPALVEVLDTAASPIAREGAACSIALICAGTSPRQQEFAKLAMNTEKEGIPESHPANLKGLEPLQRALATDPAPEVRAIAAQGLGYLGQESSAPLLGRALHDPKEEVRWWAALALAAVPGEAALGDLAHAVTADKSDRVREASVRSLGWISSDAVIPPLVRATKDTSSGVRQAAATELGRFRQDSALDALVQLFKDRSEDVRWAAVMGVGELRYRGAASALTEAMRDSSPMVANAAERALQRMGIGERSFGTREEAS